MNNQPRHLIVIGGGAAGFFCAVNAARLDPMLQVTIIEKGSKVLQKVKVSGGGRCNVTHDSTSIAEMARCYPRGERFVKKLFHHFFVKDTIHWFAERGIRIKSEPDGRMFPVTNSSQSIIDCLLQEANRFNVQLVMNFPVAAVCRQLDKWEVESMTGRKLSADFLCIACGGFPKREMFDWIAKASGHSVIAPVPSLFTFNLPKHPIASLMGVSATGIVKLVGSKLESKGPVLITHWGLSGPAVLRLSAFAARELHDKNYTYSVVVNWMPGYNEATMREKILQHRLAKGAQKLGNTDWMTLPARLWHFLLLECNLHPENRWADVPAVSQNALVKKLCGYEFQAHGKTTFKDEFVTAGGIDTAEIEVSTMASKRMPALYFAGEIINVDGVTGGYNFQFAWSSGYAAAQSIAKASLAETPNLLRPE